MIAVTNDGHNFIISLDKAHPRYKDVYIVVRSLLATYEKNYNEWLVDYDDFLVLKRKLDQLGLIEGRTMDASSIELYQTYQQADKINADLKAGVYNEHTRKALEGKLKTELYEDQVTAISYLSANKRSGCLDTMGAGKTCEVLGVIAALQKEIKKTLVVAPLQVLLDFEDQIKQHTHLKPLTIPAGKKKAEEFLQKNKDKDWDILLVHPENLVNSSKDQFNPRSKITDQLLSMPFDMVLVDEFHLYKNMDAKRSQCVSTLLSRLRNHSGDLPRAIPMTGTLVSESPNNAYMFLQIMGSSLPSLSSFEKYFTIVKELNIKRKNPVTGKEYVLKVPKVIGYKNLDILRDRLERYSIRRTKEDMKGFPDQILTTRRVILSGKQKTLYKALCKGIISELTANTDLEDFFKDENKAIRLRQLLNHPSIIGEDAKSAKYEELDSILEEVLADPTQKVVIWTEYRAAVDLIHERWNKQYGVQKLYGGVDITEGLKREFVEGKKIRIAACIPAKAGTGVDFLARARTAIYIDRPYSLTLYKQSLDRIHRRVKTEGELSWLDKIRSQPATVMFLDVAGSVDELVEDRLNMKKDMSDTTLTPKMKSISKKNLMRYLK